MNTSNSDSINVPDNAASLFSWEASLIDLAFDKAQLLGKLGRIEEAKLAYFDVLAISPTHFEALNELAALLYSDRLYISALKCYQQAVLHHQDNPVGHVNIGNLLIEIGELDLARKHFEKALCIVPGHVEALQGLVNIFEKQGDEDTAELYRRILAQTRAIVLPFRGQGQPVHVLLLAATRENVPIRQFLDDRIFHLTVIVPEHFNPAMPLPPHQLIINLIGNADSCTPALEAAEKLVALTPAPVLNPPKAVIATGRVSVANRLRHVHGVVTPSMKNLSRDMLAAPDAFSVLAACGFTAPFLLRTPGFNNGQNFLRIDSPSDLMRATVDLPGRELTVIQFLDCRNSDGKIRKYRVMMIDGKIYPLHLAIASQWKIHYYTAEMSDSPEHRAEEGLFLNNMPKVLGPRAMLALERICEILALDYAGIDFSLNGEGEILLFEANATMVVPPPNFSGQWSYRQAPIERIINALQSMLIQKASCALPESIQTEPY